MTAIREAQSLEQPLDILEIAEQTIHRMTLICVIL